MYPGSYPGSYDQVSPIYDVTDNSSRREALSNSRETGYVGRVLAKRKKNFHVNLNTSLESLLLSFVVLEFLKDTSLSKLLFRMFVQVAGLNIIDPTLRTLPSIEEIRRFSVLLVLFCNAYCFIYTVVCELPQHRLNGYLIGDWTLQFIGERPPLHKWVLLVYDTLVLALQVMAFCARQDFKVKYSDSSTRNNEGGNGDSNEPDEDTVLIKDQNVYDGIQGNLVVATISIKSFFEGAFKHLRGEIPTNNET